MKIAGGCFLDHTSWRMQNDENRYGWQ